MSLQESSVQTQLDPVSHLYYTTTTEQIKLVVLFSRYYIQSVAIYQPSIFKTIKFPTLISLSSLETSYVHVCIALFCLACDILHSLNPHI